MLVGCRIVEYIISFRGYGVYMLEIKNILKTVVGEGNLGRIDFLRDLGTHPSWGGPFNGQKFRQRIFFDILYCFPIKAIVETGTYLGTTTSLFSATSLPVYTTEIHSRSFSYSKMRFLFQSANVNLYQRDSRSFLKTLSLDSSVSKGDVFFYLDAHWKDDLPLREELDIIFSEWERPVVMIDDFQVPNTEYTFDDYGNGNRLDFNYIEPVVSARNLSVFYPAINSSVETGVKRGSVVLCNEMSGTEIERKISTLVRDNVCCL